MTPHFFTVFVETKSLTIHLFSHSVFNHINELLTVMHKTAHNDISCFHVPSADPDKPPREDGIELLQDFCMPTRIHKLWESRDRNYIFLLGDDPSQIKCLDVHQMSMKYSRFFRDEAIDGLSLSDDFRKFAVLMRHRNQIEFHDQNGVYTTFRAPSQPNSMFFNETSGQLLLPSFDANAVGRLSLQTGAMLQPYDISATHGHSSAVGARAACTLSAHNLDLIGCEDGGIRCFDTRSTDNAATHGAASSVSLPGDFHAAVTSLSEDPYNSFHFVAGTAEGVVLIYDMRKRQPVLVKNHCNDLPIKKISFYKMDSFSRSLGASHGGHMLCSMDARSVHFWDDALGETVTVAEPFTAPTGRKASKNVFDYAYRASTPPSIHDFTIISGDANGAKHSGLMMLGMEQGAGYGLFVPHFGPAPQWCGYLDRLAMEKAERAEEAADARIQQDFVFISQAEFKELGISEEDADVDVIRPMLNGYLIDHKHLRFLRDALEARKPYQRATKGAKLTKKLKKQDPITPVEPIKRKKKAKKEAEVDDRFAGRMQSAPEFAVEAETKATADKNRSTAYDAMFASVRGLDESKGPRTMRLQKHADFYARDADIAQSYEMQHLQKSQSLGKVAEHVKKRKAGGK